MKYQLVIKRSCNRTKHFYEFTVYLRHYTKQCVNTICENTEIRIELYQRKMASSAKKVKLNKSSTTEANPTSTHPERFTFFWKAQSPFSQFHFAKFHAKPLFITTKDDENGYTFLHCEQWMMFNKAKLFKDEITAKKILEAVEPPQCKALGRQVGNFKEAIWKQENEKIVLEGNRLKFAQNPCLLEKLMETEGTTLVEASPRDCLYGIGLSEKNPKAQNRSTWRGKNLLGELLTKLREELKSNEGTN